MTPDLKLAKPRVTYIVCLQCKTILYEGTRTQIGPSHYEQKWTRMETRYPHEPPKSCPQCHGATLQQERAPT